MPFQVLSGLNKPAQSAAAAALSAEPGPRPRAGRAERAQERRALRAALAPANSLCEGPKHAALSWVRGARSGLDAVGNTKKEAAVKAISLHANVFNLLFCVLALAFGCTLNLDNELSRVFLMIKFFVFLIKSWLKQHYLQ